MVLPDIIAAISNFGTAGLVLHGVVVLKHFSKVSQFEVLDYHQFRPQTPNFSRAPCGLVEKH